MTVDQALQEFLLACAADGLADTTIKWYRSLLTAYAQGHGALSVDDVTTRELRAYIVSLRNKAQRFEDAPQRPQQSGGYSRDTVKGHVTALHRFWAWVSDEYEIPNPMQKIRRVKRTSPRIKSINEQDFIKLFDATEGSKCPERDRAMLAVLADTGVRLGGLLSMTTERTDNHARRAIVTEKGQKQRTVYFTHFTSLLLIQWQALRDSKSNALWVSLETGEPLTASGVHEMLKRLKRRAGVKGRVNPHAFRHQFARKYIMSGGDISTLAKILGHTDIQTTHNYYAIFNKDEIAGFHDRYGSIDQWFNESGGC